MAAFEEFDEISFFSLSTLLSVCQGQQEPEGHNAASEAEISDSEDWHLGSEKDSVRLHELSSLDPNERLLIRFLDHRQGYHVDEACELLQAAAGDLRHADRVHISAGPCRCFCRRIGWSCSRKRIAQFVSEIQSR